MTPDTYATDSPAVWAQRVLIFRNNVAGILH